VRGWVPFVVLLLAGCMAPTSPPPTTAPEGPPPAAEGDGRPPHRVLTGGESVLELVAQAAAPGGYRVWTWDDRAYLATFTSRKGIVIYNISEPAAPREIGALEGEFARGVDVLPYDTRTLVTVPQDTALAIFDVTDPSEPHRVAHFELQSHNVAVHRAAKVLYNSRSLGTLPGAVEIFDARDPDAIRLHKVWEFPRTAADGTPVLNPGCHDVTVWPARERAYCAAITQTLIWDIHDPLEPRVLTAIGNPLIQAHHTAIPLLNHSVLLIGDEAGAGFADACFGGYGAATAPHGTLWFYDLTQSPPALVSRLDPPPVESLLGYCSSHNGWEMPQAPGLVSYGWVRAGALLINARDPGAPRILDQARTGTGVWDVQPYRGFLFGADDGKGLLVLRAAAKP
jgi:hypothetical protein